MDTRHTHASVKERPPAVQVARKVFVGFLLFEAIQALIGIPVGVWFALSTYGLV